jgi:hypothetical protein
MTRNSKRQVVAGQGSRPFNADQRLKELGIKLPAPPEPYVEAVQTGHLLFLSGMLLRDQPRTRAERRNLYI